MTTDPHPWAADLATLHAQVWARLVRGVGDRHAPARHPTFATISPAGWPEARTVVLRAADPVMASLDIYTDLRSAKVASLQANPRAALHIWDASAHLQTRIEVTVAIRSGDAVADLWARLTDQSRLDYGTIPAPGVAVPEALAYVKVPDPVIFAVLHCSVQAMDIVHLGPQHRRARFAQETDWAGAWLSP